jgi:hypothetical protein
MLPPQQSRFNSWKTDPASLFDFSDWVMAENGLDI